MELLTLSITREREGVTLCASLRPQLHCLCLEHEWRVKIEGPRGLVVEWGWRAKAGEEGYRGFSVRWRPPEEGLYRASAELASHGLRAEGSFRYTAAEAALVYYSRTGATRALAERLREALRALGLAVEAHELKVKREYARPLHLNPRLILDTLRGSADIELSFDPCAYPAVIVACPVWAGRPAAPAAAFVRLLASRCPGKPVACVTTSALALDYSARLAKLAEKLGLKVVFRGNAPRGEPLFSVEELARALQT